MRHRLRKMVRSFRVITPCFKITPYGWKAMLRYPYGDIGKSGFIKRIKKPARRFK